MPDIFSTNVEMNRIAGAHFGLKFNFLYERGDEPLLPRPRN